MTRIAGPTRAQLDQAADQYAGLLDRQLARAVDLTMLTLGDRFDADDLGIIPQHWAALVDDLLAPTLALALHAGSADIRQQLRRHLGLTAAAEVFHLPGKHNQATHGHGGGYHGAHHDYGEIEGRLGDLDARKTDRFGSDPMLHEIAREQGFDGPPEVVDDLQPHIDAGEQELFRGVSSPEFVESFKTGDYWAGQGTLGDGTYTVKAGGEVGHRALASYDGHLRMTLHKDAKTISLDEAEAELERLEGEAVVKYGSRSAIPKPLKRLLIDPGQWAAASGYDAIDVPRRQWMIVLNRTALRVQKGPVTVEP